MSGHTQKRGFLGEAAFGFVVSLIAAAVAATLSYLMPAALVIRLVVTGLGLTFVVRAIGQSEDRTGRVLCLVAWTVAAAAVWLAGVGLPIFVIVHVTLAWLVRSLFTYSRIVEAGVDFGLTLLALSFGVYAAVRTDSTFLATWSFLLVHALHVTIPGVVSRWSGPKEHAMPLDDPNRGFADAFKAADDALHRIAGQRSS